MKNTHDREHIILTVILGLLAVAMTIYILGKSFFPGDLAVSRFVQSLANDGLTAFMQGLAYIFGSWRAAILTTFCVVLVAWRIGKTEAGLVVIAGLLSLLNYLFKALIERPRPSVDLVQVLAKESNYSFPSSHAFFSILILGVLVYLFNKQCLKSSTKTISSFLLGLLILLVGITRVYLGVHWYSDVIAGYIFGGFFLSLLIMSYEKWQYKTQFNLKKQADRN